MVALPSFPFRLAFLLTLTLLLFLVGGRAEPVHADVTFTVTRRDDPTPGICWPWDCSLREAVIAANATPGEDTIRLPVVRDYILTIPEDPLAPDSAETGDLLITDDLVITSQFDGFPQLAGLWVGNIGLTPDVFKISAGTSVEMTLLEIAVSSDSNYMGIWNEGTLTFMLGEVRGYGNTAIYNREGTTYVSWSQLSGGIVGYGGAVELFRADVGWGAWGIDAAGTEFDISQSSIHHNGSPVWPPGGGISTNAPLTVTNSTITSNGTEGETLPSRGIDASGPTTLTNVTIADNTGIGVDSFQTVVTLSNTIVANNGDDDCDGSIASAGHNLDSDGTCGLSAAKGDLLNTNPGLLPLVWESGTHFHPLFPGSPAIDAGDSGACPGDDQRGVTRPKDGDGNGSAVCDIGAYEFVSVLVGDVDCDEDVDAVDALFTLQNVAGVRAASGKCPPPSGSLFQGAADADCDLDVDAVDALFVLQHVAGSRPKLCPP